MALVSSLFTAITGMRNHQTLLDVISNNVANVNTVGFKAGRVQFRDLLSQTISGASGSDSANNRGGTNPVQFGTGVAVASIDTSFRQGTLQATGNATDMAINGDGFFISQSGTSTLYTRAGSFRFDSLGRLVDPSGGLIQGWSASLDPNDPLLAPTVDSSNPSNIGNITINAGQTLQPYETRNIELSGNLDAGATSANLVNSLGQSGTRQLTVVDGAAVTTNPIVGEHVITFSVFDSLGNSHQLSATLLNLSGTQVPSQPTGTFYDNNTWSWSVDTDPADTTVNLALDGTEYVDPADPTGNTTIRAASSGIMHFNTNGSLDYVVYQDRNAEHFGTATNLPPTWTPLADTLDDSIIGFEGATIPAGAAVPFANTQAFDLEKLPIVLVYQNVPAGMAPPPSGTTAGTLANLTHAGGGMPNEAWYVQHVDIDWGTVSTITGAIPDTAGAAGEDVNGLDFVMNPTGITRSALGLRDGLTQDTTGEFRDIAGVSTYVPSFTAFMRAQDGYDQGILQGVSVSADGTILGSFTNNQTRELARIAIATFENPAGLAKVGGTTFTPTANSGNAIIGEALAGGRGSVIGGVVEQSNVDLSEELTNMIVAQRGFEVNARLITTSDRILDTLVNLGR